MGRWDDRERKKERTRKIENALLRFDAKVQSYFPSFLKKGIRMYRNWVYKHGIQIPLWLYCAICVSYFAFVFVLSDMLLDGIVLVGDGRLVITDGSIGSNQIAFPVSDLCKVIAGIIMLLLIAVSNSGGGTGRRDDDERGDDGSPTINTSRHGQRGFEGAP